MMNTLQSSCSNEAIYRNFNGKFSVSQHFHLKKPGSCCLPLGKISKARYLYLISVRQKASVPVRCSSLVPNSKVEVDAAETQLPNAYQLKTVHVRFQLQKECSFGEHFFMVGDDPLIGLWDPNCALPLNWSDGHIWSIELDIPVGKSISFKFVLKRINGSLLWQPGPNRTLQTWETVNTITVLEDWESAEYQKVAEETVVSEQVEELRDDKENEVLVEILAHAVGDIDHNLYQEEMPVQAKPHNVASNDNSPLRENPKPIAAENILLPTKDSLANQNEMLGEERMGSTSDVSAALSSQSMLVADTILESNCSDLSAENHSSKGADSTLFIHEEDPVLVPGLSPSSTVPTRGTTLQADDKATTTDDPARVSETRKHNQPELDEKQESNLDPVQPKQEPNVDPVQTKLAERPTGNGQEVLGNVDHMPNHGVAQANHKPLKAIKEQKDSESSQSDLLQNDIQWGRRVLQKFLNNLGML